MRSTFIVGFPGETDSDFAYLLDWLDEAESIASDASNTSRLPARHRTRSVTTSGRDQAGALECADGAATKDFGPPAKTEIGTRQQVIIDEVGPTVSKGRTKADAPEIDGAVYVSSRRPLRIGEIVTAKIERSDQYDLHGSVAGF